MITRHCAITVKVPYHCYLLRLLQGVIVAFAAYTVPRGSTFHNGAVLLFRFVYAVVLSEAHYLGPHSSVPACCLVVMLLFFGLAPIYQS